MSFRDFITNRSFRRRISDWFARWERYEPPANPSRQYIEKRIQRLLDKEQSWVAKSQLKMIGKAAAPILVKAIKDPRFAAPESISVQDKDPSIEVILELLAPHEPQAVIEVASRMAVSTCNKVRKRAAFHLASTGSADAVPMLADLLNDSDGHVRSFVTFGVDFAQRNGSTDHVFRERMYELLLAQCDQEWTDSTSNDAPETVLALNKDRASLDLASERFLSISNPNISDVLKACNRAGVVLPPERTRQLFEHAAQAIESGERYPETYIASGALIAFARVVGAHAIPLIDRIRGVQDDRLEEAVGEATLAAVGVADPYRHVLELTDQVGLDGLTSHQAVVFDASVFDDEVCNGGIMQFFGNSSGDRAVETLKALREIGVEEAIVALDTAIKRIGPLARERDTDTRLAAFEGRFDELREAFSPLEEAYYREKGKFRQAVLLYAAHHADEFRD